MQPCPPAPCSPTLWAFNKHVQTLIGLLRRYSIRGTTFSRTHIMTGDGGTLGLDWFGSSDKESDALPGDVPVLLVLHGINGGSHEG